MDRDSRNLIEGDDVPELFGMIDTVMENMDFN